MKLRSGRQADPLHPEQCQQTELLLLQVYQTWQQSKNTAKKVFGKAGFQSRFCSVDQEIVVKDMDASILSRPEY